MDHTHKSAPRHGQAVANVDDACLAHAVLIDIKTACQVAGLTRSRIYELVAAPGSKFPKPLKIGRSTRWYRHELLEWAQSLRAPAGEQVQASGTARAAASSVVRLRHYDLVLNEASGQFDLVMRFDRLKARPKPWSPTVPMVVKGRPASARAEQQVRPAAANASLKTKRATHKSINDVEEMKRQYDAGATLDDLVAWHRTGKATVLRQLRDAGTALRKPGPRPKKSHAWPKLNSEGKR